jgi:alkanesulfonate monooxygenase SsuD/methylene tetrahydromethanopterin reductase-like flavin-dependent oxidoreductase (luciferase family)
MHLMYFTEQPMSTYPAEAGDDLGYTALLFPNRYFDPAEGSRLYNERLEEYVWAEEMGVDGIMLNEHHNAPFCMSARINIVAAMLAARTQRVKIVLLGNPLPIIDNPVLLAEELAMIDMVSRGRLVAGIVRGGGTEQFASNANPAFNRERFEEAHDLMVAAWTRPGPFRWEGTHYQFRIVNPWATPLQKPHPRVWVPGVFSTETIIWAAQHRYPYIALNTTIDATKQIWKTYDDAAREVGYEAGPEQRGYLLQVHVADTEERALANAREFMWMQGEFTGLAHPVWSAPSGYYSSSMRRAFVERANGRAKRQSGGGDTFEEKIENLRIIAGTPDQCVERLKVIMRETRPGIFAFWGNDGKVGHQDSMRCIQLLGQEVMPAVRDHAKELGLTSPFEVDSPVSLEFSTQATGAAAG